MSETQRCTGCNKPGAMHNDLEECASGRITTVGELREALFAFDADAPLYVCGADCFINVLANGTVCLDNEVIEGARSVQGRDSWTVE